jgi:hypothetical protein
MHGVGSLCWGVVDERVSHARAVSTVLLVRALGPEIGLAAFALLPNESVLLEERYSELLFTNLR